MLGRYTLVLVLVVVLASAENIAKVDGDIKIAGLFEIESRKGNNCGPINTDSVVVLEATRWYIEQLNEHNALPFKLGFEGYNTCGLPRVAVERALDITCRHRNYNSTGDANDFFIGFIGPSLSEESQQVSEFLTRGTRENSFLQISVSATATTLGHRQAYPNYFTVIPDDSKQIQTMIELMKELDWNRIAIMYEDNLYCKSCIESLVEQAQQNLICVSKQFAINISATGDISIGQINAYLDQIMLHSPVIGGVVLFASKDVTNKVLLAVDSKGIDNVPVFIISESAGLRDDIFMSAQGTVMPKSKGTLIVTPPYTEITSFTDYWSSLMMNSTLLKEKVSLNPWLLDVFVYIANCNPLSEPACQGLPKAQIDSNFPIQPVYLQYGILAAHTMAKAALQLYNELCPSNSTDCVADFKKGFKPYLMTEEMKGLTVDVREDFPTVEFDPLKNSSHQMTFGNSAGPDTASHREIYQVYNYRGVSNDFKLMKVGSLNGHHHLNLSYQDLRDYAANGTELNYPNLRRAQCPPNKKCSECIKPDIPEMFLHVPGDLYVIGIVPVHGKAISGPIGCGSVRTRDGYQLALALQYGLQMFNSSDYLGDRAKFGDEKIGLIVLDSCWNNLTIARKILDLHVFGITLENGQRLDLTNKIIGYVGGLASWVSVSAATQLTITGHVQVSFGSTYPTLSDNILYPYFLRIVSPDSVQADAMMEVIKAIKGEYVQVVYNECSCGSARKNSIAEMARKHGICVAQFIEVKQRDDYFEFYEILRKKPHAKLVIIFLSPHILPGFIRDQNEIMQKGEFQFLGSEAWGGNYDLLNYDIVKGALSVTMQLEEVRGLRAYIQQKVPNKQEYNPWLEEYLQKRQNCYFDWSYDKTFSRQCTAAILPPAETGSFKTDFWSDFATNSLLALLKGSAEFYKKSCVASSENLCHEFVSNPTGLYEEVKKVSMDISGTGSIKLFDSVGDGNLGFQVHNVREDEKGNGLMFARVGRYSMKVGLDIYTENIVYPTITPIVSSCPNEKSCQNCSDSQPPTQGPSQESTDVGKVVLGFLVGVFAVTILLLIGILVLEKRKTKEDPYLTPSMDLVRPEAVGKSDSPYHSSAEIEETSY